MMNLIKAIINFFKILWSFILNLFKKKKKAKKKMINKQIKDNINNKINYKANVIFNGESSKKAKWCYTISEKDLVKINYKLEYIQKKLKNNNDLDLEYELIDLNEIKKIISQEQVYQIIQINNLLDGTIIDPEFNLNTRDKISILKDNITNLVDNNSKEINDIIDKAYFQYEKVNYIIVTTLLIDGIVDNFKKITTDIKKNKYSKYDYLRKIKEIKDKISSLEALNNKEEVQKELDRLKADLYTKQKDKYDLLFNNEIFINIKICCDKLIQDLEHKEKNVQSDKERRLIKNENEKKEFEKNLKEQNKVKKDKNKRPIKEQDNNIIKRFKDLELAFNILRMQEIKRKKKLKSDILTDTFDGYKNFLIGEQNKFNFLRNQLKTEVAKLYNDTLSNICNLENSEFIPIEHINVRFSTLIQDTIDNQEHLANLILEKKKIDITTSPITQNVNKKLENIQKKEKEREELAEKPKIYVRTYQKIVKDNKDEKNKKINQN